MRATTIAKTMTHACVLGVAALGCVTAGHDTRPDRAPTLRAPSATVAPDPSIAPQRTSDVLTAVELSTVAGVAGISLYDALVRLRSRFLNSREVRTSIVPSHVPPAVFVNGSHWGGPEALRGIPASRVADVQYVRPMDALHRFGPAYPAGVILVRLRR